MCECVCVCMFICACACVCVCMCTCVCVCVCVCPSGNSDSYVVNMVRMLICLLAGLNSVCVVLLTNGRISSRGFKDNYLGFSF